MNIHAGSSVTITVNNDVDLVQDISCNKTVGVMLLCRGVSLTQLRWSYYPNSDANSHITSPYQPETAPEKTPMLVLPDVNGAFLTVQLLEVTSINSSDRANFSSILTVDLLGLINQNVTKIVCGDIATTQEKSVIQLVDEVVKLQPKIRATYELGILTDVQVQLNNLVSMYICNHI